MTSDNDFNFDEWANLAATDPAEFEKRRLAQIEALIRQSPEELHRRLRGLQFQIEMERRRAKTPMGAAVRVSSLMWEAFAGKNGFQETLNRMLSDDPKDRVPAPFVREGIKASVVPFRPNESPRKKF
jgi:hypothetical protein